jgi:hypothetical protein
MSITNKDNQQYLASNLDQMIRDLKHEALS